MGYSTDFFGSFKLNKKLDGVTHKLLVDLANTRRMKRDANVVGHQYGVDGEFYVEDDSKGVLEHNYPPSTQPGLWCQWIPTLSGDEIVWDGNEKFYNYVEWLQYIVDKILKPKGYVLNGTIEYSGEEVDDRGEITVKDNKISSINYDEQRKQLLKENDYLKSQLADKILLEENNG